MAKAVTLRGAKVKTSNYSMLVRIALLNNILIKHDVVTDDEQPRPIIYSSTY